MTRLYVEPEAEEELDPGAFASQGGSFGFAQDDIPGTEETVALPQRNWPRTAAGRPGHPALR